MMELTLHAAAEADIPAIFALSKALIDDYEDKTLMDCEKVLAWVERKLHRCIGGYRCILVDGVKAGYFRLTEGEKDMELDDFYILPEFRGRGIGTAVLKRWIMQSRKPVFLYVFTKNTRAVALYERCGFKVTEQISPTRAVMTWTPEESHE